MGFFVKQDGSYYEGDKVDIDDVSVIRRPDFTYDWNGSTWVQNATRASAEAIKSALQNFVSSDATIATLRGMTQAQFDAWWSANVTNIAQAGDVLKRLTRAVILKL